jgi:hypothetical protein
MKIYSTTILTVHIFYVMNDNSFSTKFSQSLNCLTFEKNKNYIRAGENGSAKWDKIFDR